MSRARKFSLERTEHGGPNGAGQSRAQPRWCRRRKPREGTWQGGAEPETQRTTFSRLGQSRSRCGPVWECGIEFVLFLEFLLCMVSKQFKL